MCILSTYQYFIFRCYQHIAATLVVGNIIIVLFSHETWVTYNYRKGSKVNLLLMQFVRVTQEAISSQKSGLSRPAAPHISNNTEANFQTGGSKPHIGNLNSYFIPWKILKHNKILVLDWKLQQLGAALLLHPLMFNWGQTGCFNDSLSPL